jgi:hypothetical protein
MSDQNVETQAERFGSKFAQMFGYVTPEDRGKWEQQRAQNKKSVSALKQAAKMSSGSMMDFGERNINARLTAAHRVVEQTQFDETHTKTTTSRVDPKTQSITESYGYSAKEESENSLEPDFEA